MKWNTLILAAGLIVQSSFAAFATSADDKNFSEADQKWAGTIEKLIVKGTTEFTTPSSERAELAKSLAAKLGWNVKIQKKDKNFVLKFEQTQAAR
jgi:putative sterol carrier protein